jgi:hypothetical protein
VAAFSDENDIHMTFSTFTGGIAEGSCIFSQFDCKFTTRKVDPLGASVWFAVGDLNGDGVKDIVAIDSGDDYIYIQVGNPDGSFGDFTPFPTYSYYPAAVGVGRFGDPLYNSVAVANSCSEPTCAAPGNVSIFLGKGNGTFAPAITYPAGLYPYDMVPTTDCAPDPFGTSGDAGKCSLIYYGNHLPSFTAEDPFE